jgi:transcriptional regulator with XRE-family HTH domain
MQGKKLKLARLNKDISQKILSEISGIKLRRIELIESNRSVFLRRFAYHRRWI